MTRLLPVDPLSPSLSVFQEAVAVLWQGGLVSFPTESFYGLGANALDPGALTRVYRVKGRPESKPLLVLVDSVKMAESLAAEISETARNLMARHWPGPLTLVLRARQDLPAELTARTGTIGIRMPGHPVALGLVRAAGVALTAPSANPSGKPPPSTAQEVLEGLQGSIDLILDGGPTAGGLPSTVLDVSVTPPRLIRQGAAILS